MENYTDTSFDEQFEESDSFTWLPWIGKEYTKSKVKTLILGESTYNWAVQKDNREKVEDSLVTNNHLRIVHKKNAIDFNGKSPYARNIERAIFLRKKSSKPEAELLWTNVAYHNLVLRPMPTKKHRPKYEDYLNGWNAFINLTNLIDVEQCVVYGLEKNKLKSFKEAFDKQGLDCKLIKSKSGVGRSYPRTATIKINNKEIKLLFIRHPSSFFSWKNWGNIINKELNMVGLLQNEDVNNG